MDLCDAMAQNLCELPPDATLREAADKMRQLDVDALPVCENDDLVGVVSEHDITTRAVAEGKDPNQTTVRDVMSWQLFYVVEGGC